MTRFIISEDGSELLNIDYIRRIYIFEGHDDKQFNKWYVKAEIDDRTSEDHDYKLLRTFDGQYDAESWLKRVMDRYN
jgi:hypothetical protein